MVRLGARGEWRGWWGVERLGVEGAHIEPPMDRAVVRSGDHFFEQWGGNMGFLRWEWGNYFLFFARGGLRAEGPGRAPFSGLGFSWGLVFGARA